MHAGIDYQRYLAEKEATHAEWKDWEKKHGAKAIQLGLMPTSEERSSVDYEEDMRQRIFLSKQDVERARAANPHANFSIDVVYSIMTKEEFATKIMNSFAKGNSTITTRLPTPKPRNLRAQYNFTSSTNNEAVPLGESMAAAKFPVTAMSATSATRSPSFGRHGSPAASTKKQSVSTKPTSKPITASNEAATVTQTVDWSRSACMSPIQNQGQCGDCWAFAATAAVESAQCIAGGQKSLHKYSEQQLVSCNTQNHGCNGGAPQYAFDYILKNGGFCSETAFPYASSEGHVPSCARCNNANTGIKDYKVLDKGDEAGLIQAINQRPTVVTVAAGNEAWKQYTGGVLSSCDTSALDHLVVAVGYDATSLKIRNSWGDNWGEDGYIRLKRKASGSGTCSVLQQMVPLEV
ncbi:papain-like cysteine protease C1 [Phytophthora sojae]|uniref:Papain-like cysteine protease C1 n=1 Tax=Phytophthora sojae (strain P6497) TaxID=1094619 RepID=G4YZQ7_PHYSP|nr:papain-like cysteine protease C1 [Phytophthora sojae]EGZ25825.1 papain-like cysteine protease C1 [Phytophthora sojae]|eukprot:XP_009521113.1 papain-like cysteine protease C1 [Phytophthora sojae]